MTKAKYDWNTEHPAVIAGHAYAPPTQNQVSEYFEHTGHPHPWRCWDAGGRYIAFNKDINMRYWSNPNNYVEGLTGAIAPICGTAGCHGGTAAVIIPNLTGNTQFYHCYGVNILSAYLIGDAEKDKLKTWAFSNPHIWGNSNGDFMFAKTALAFNKSGNILTSKEIGQWWQEVARRIVAATHNK